VYFLSLLLLAVGVLCLVSGIRGYNMVVPHIQVVSKEGEREGGREGGAK
jgi:hypothetical protein